MDKSNGFSLGRDGLHARAGVALGTLDVARSGERRDEQERHRHGDGAEGSSQASRADAGAESRRVQRPRAKYCRREQEVLATWGGSAKQAGSCGLNRP